METAPSTASGPLSTASDEDPGPDPNATYAQVNIEQKRASWRNEERRNTSNKKDNSHAAINMECYRFLGIEFS